MDRFISWVCAGLAAFLFLPTANGQGVKDQRFTDVAAAAGVAGKVQGMGVALFDCDKDGFLDVFVAGRPVNQVARGIIVVDVDNDGWPDLFVTEKPGVFQLYRNNGNGKFTDVTKEVLARDRSIETIKIEGGKVEITGQTIKIEGGKVEIIRHKP